MTLAIRWPHQAGDFVSCWPHEPAHRHTSDFNWHTLIVQRGEAGKLQRGNNAKGLLKTSAWEERSCDLRLGWQIFPT